MGEQGKCFALTGEVFCDGIRTTSSTRKFLFVLLMIDESIGERETKRGRTSFTRSSVEFPSSGDSDIKDETMTAVALASPVQKVQLHGAPSLQTRSAKLAQFVNGNASGSSCMLSLFCHERTSTNKALRKSATIKCVSISERSPGLRCSSSMRKLLDSSGDESMPLPRKRLNQ